jgi:hypothetical protein
MNDNQHYVSKAHLDKFIHPNSKQNVLYPYRKGSGSLRATGTKHLASADHFYLQQESGQQTNRLDESRKQNEAVFFASGKRTSGPLARCVYEDDFKPTYDEKIMLAGSAAFLRCGSPAQVHNTAMLAVLANQIWAFNSFNTDQLACEYRKRFGEDAGRKLDEDRKAFWEGGLFVDVGEENWKQLGFTSFESEKTWLEALSRMRLTICEAHPKSFFATSDNPVILTANSQSDRPGLGLSDAEVWFPISYKRGLLWTWKSGQTEKTTLGHSATRIKNRLMIRWCYREIYAPLPEDWIASAVKEEKFDPCFGHYGSLKEFAENHLINALDETGKKREIIDLVSGLKAGAKLDVLGLRR